MMTNEQAIDWLIAIKEKYIHGGDEGFDELRKEALDVAIKALKVDLWQLRQEATENALKKAEVLYKRPQGKWHENIPKGCLKARHGDYVLYKVDFLLDNLAREVNIMEGARRMRGKEE